MEVVVASVTSAEYAPSGGANGMPPWRNEIVASSLTVPTSGVWAGAGRGGGGGDGGRGTAGGRGRTPPRRPAGGPADRGAGTPAPRASTRQVIGIDPGTAACGYGIVHGSDGRLRAVASGAGGRPRGAARRAAADDLRGSRELIAEHEPDAVALEESYVGADARIALSVGQARGAVLVAAAGPGSSALSTRRRA